MSICDFFRILVQQAFLFEPFSFKLIPKALSSLMNSYVAMETELGLKDVSI